jgi:uncharacterized protein YegP (UPF0339 family)
MPGKFVIVKSSGGYHFNLLATKGKVIAFSEHYESQAAAMRGIESVRKNAPNAVLVEDDGRSARSPRPCRRGKNVYRCATSRPQDG